MLQSETARGTRTHWRTLVLRRCCFATARDHSVAIAGGGGTRRGPGGVSGLASVGSRSVNVVRVEQWVATTLPVPSTSIIGVELIFPDGTSTGIELFTNTLLTDTPVTPGSQDTVGSEYSVGRTIDNMIALASSQTGDHRLTIWTVG